jgi:hypothetical protein
MFKKNKDLQQRAGTKRQKNATKKKGRPIQGFLPPQSPY